MTKLVTPMSAGLSHQTLDEVVHVLGNVPLARVMVRPRIGEATDEDVLTVSEHHRRCELVDGILVEKAVGYFESQLAAMLCYFLQSYLRNNPLGALFGEAAPFRTISERVRLPDVAFVLWRRYLPPATGRASVSEIAPDLAIEILSLSNTTEEMQKKLDEYFRAGVRHVWYIDPVAKSAELFTSPTNSIRVDQDGFLAAEDLLPGFRLQLRELFQSVAPPAG